MGENNSTPPAQGGKILVTGANGQLGKELKQLAPSFPQFEFIFLSKQDLPIQHFKMVRDYFKTYRPKCLVNCAAYTAVDRAEAEKDLAFQVNAEAVGVLAAVCKENHTRFIHFSTDYVFDGTATTPYTENAATGPLNVYGASKLEGEKQAFHFNPDSIIVRTSWVYSEYGKNFVRTMLKLLSEKEEINVVNDQFGSPTYAADLAEVVIQIIPQLPPDSYRDPGTKSSTPDSQLLFHFSNEGVISWYDFALAIKELSGSPCKINAVSSNQFTTGAKRPAYSVLDKTKIRETFGIKLRDWKLSLSVCLQKIRQG